MIRSSLNYNRGADHINLMLSDLREIDSVTSSFYDVDDFILDSSVWGVMKNYTDGNIDGKDISLEVVCPDGVRRKLPIIFNDKDRIIIDTSSEISDDSEIEKARKLLHSSKNKMFLRMFMANRELCESANYEIMITSIEANYISRNGIPIPIIDSNRCKRVNILDVFNAFLKAKKPGMIRNLFEDSLSVWEGEMNDLSYDEIYYYSRTLRLLSNEYKASVRGKAPDRKLVPIKDLDYVKNLKI